MRRTGALSRRRLLAGVAGVGAAGLISPKFAAAAGASIDLAPMAAVDSLFMSGDSKVAALSEPALPRASSDWSRGMWGTWPRRDAQWVEYSWAEPVTTASVEIYWARDGGGIAPPRTARLLYWNGDAFVPVPGGASLGVAGDRVNALAFAPVTTRRLRLEMEAAAERSVGLLRWRVMSAGPLPALAPIVAAGIDRSVVTGGRTYLSGSVRRLQPAPGDSVRWEKASGPGEVVFADAGKGETVAGFSRPGDYQLKLTGTAQGKAASSTLRVRAVAAPPKRRLDVVYTTPYTIDSPLWNARTKSLIVSWIPHCIAYCERTDLPTGQGGIDNFVEAAKALRGELHGKHLGYVFSNAWVHQTIESMCLALMVDPQGDREMIDAQAHMRATLERWIPIVLAAQEPDGYLHTAYTLADRATWPRRWSPEHRADHEGYVAGYFIESAINHHMLTGGRDLRLYDAAKKLADCWVANIGPGKKAWFDGHQEMEQALVRFGRFVNDVEGQGRGDPYVRLARFLLDSREGGSEYDQSHLPPERQYAAVGHAVRAMYFYSGMADIAAETGDTDYQSAVVSLWDNMVNRKYYVTGGVGSGDTAEGFGVDYAMRHDAYCESCSSCGLIFFQYKMNLAYHDARYADLYEETMYNALLGSVDLAGQSFCYTNPLVDTERAKWHACPCCVGNIPRTLLMAPTWAYARQGDRLFVNLFIGSRMQVGEVAGTRVEMVQKTDYPWNGKVAITINPAAPTTFAVHVRMPDRTTSELYRSTPAVAGLTGLTVNGKAVPVVAENGYAVIRRAWKAGDQIAFDLPMKVQRVHAINKVEDTREQVALRYGPLIYSVERADQPDIDKPLGAALPKPVWRPDLLGGVVALEGRWQDGTPMTAIPYYARANRTGAPVREFPIADGSADYAPGALGTVAAAAQPKVPPVQPGFSRVWAKDTA